MRLSRRTALRLALVASFLLVAVAPAVAMRGVREAPVNASHHAITSVVAAVSLPPAGGPIRGARALGLGFAALIGAAGAAIAVVHLAARRNANTHPFPEFAYRYAGRSPPRS